MKKYTIIIVVAVLFFASCSTYKKGEGGRGYVQLTGLVNSNNKSIGDVSVTLAADGHFIRSLAAQDTFEVQLGFQNKYEIVVSKTGYYSNKIEFDTNVPDGMQKYVFEYGLHFNLLDSIEGDTTTMVGLSTWLGYDENKDNFVFQKKNLDQ